MASIKFSAPAASAIGTKNVTISYSTSDVVSNLGSCTESLYNNNTTRDLLISVSVYINGTLKDQETVTSKTGWEIAHGSKGASFTIYLKLSYDTYKPFRTQEGTTTIYYYYTYTRANGTSGRTNSYISYKDAHDEIPEGATNIVLHSRGGDPIYSYSWVYSRSGSIFSTEHTRYGKPDPWKFSYSNTDYTWVVDKGIQTLITNITDFPTAAKKYKQWENQSSQNDCNSLFSNNELSASQINSALLYTTGISGSYNAGDSVSKAIFDSLQSKINYSTS